MLREAAPPPPLPLQSPLTRFKKPQFWLHLYPPSWLIRRYGLTRNADRPMNVPITNNGLVQGSVQGIWDGNKLNRHHGMVTHVSYHCTRHDMKYYIMVQSAGNPAYWPLQNTETSSFPPRNRPKKPGPLLAFTTRITSLKTTYFLVTDLLVSWSQYSLSTRHTSMRVWLANLRDTLPVIL